jgi:hypothetical protein
MRYVEAIRKLVRASQEQDHLEAVTSDEQRDAATVELVPRVFENVETGCISQSNEKTVVETTPTLISALRPPPERPDPTATPSRRRYVPRKCFTRSSQLTWPRR